MHSEAWGDPRDPREHRGGHRMRMRMRGGPGGGPGPWGGGPFEFGARGGPFGPPRFGGRALRLTARNVNLAGAVSGFAPPGDIHRVRNTGDTVAISMHVYGADISRLGNSIRREYPLPVRA